MEYKKISVLIVTYKQADVIGRNLDSILQQKEYGLHEIVICDDCSPDNNWEVIQSYVQKYPNIIRAYRNNPNLGIYGNSNRLVTLKGNSDLYCWLEGDDALCDGFFKRAQEYISNNGIDTDESVALLSDFKTMSPDGKVVSVFKNDYLSKHHVSPFGAKIRGLVTWRGSLFSKKVLDNFKPVITEKGLNLAESLFDSQYFEHCNKFYYLGGIGSIYYASIGISNSLDKQSPYQTIQAIQKWEYLLDNKLTSRCDIYWAKSNLIRIKHLMHPNISNIFTFCFYFLLGILPYGINWKDIKQAIKSMLFNKSR